MAQVPGLGLDQAQLADVINRQYKGYSQKQRNQMMQSAAASPDNWGAITQQANKTATQPSEFLGAGRTSDIPSVSMGGQKLTGYDDSNLSSLYNMNSGYKDTPFDYIDSSGKGYYTPETSNRIESSAPNFISGAKTSYDLNPTKAGGYYFSDPWGFSHSVSKVGPNKYFVSENTLNENTRSGTADTWFSLNPNADLSGLQYGQFQGQNGLFFDPTKTNLSSLLTPGRDNSAYAEKKSGGLLGVLNEVIQKVDPLNYIVEKGVANLLGYDSGLDMVRSIGEPIGNLAGAIWSGGIPWGSIVAGADNLSTGNDQAILGNIVNGLVSYGGSQISLGGTGGAPVGTAVGSSGAAANSMSGSAGGIFGSGVSLGSTAANQAAQAMLMNAGANYARTGDLENALKAAAFSTASGAAGNWLGSATASSLGEIGSKALGGAARGGLNSLFTKNSPIEGSLFGAMSGGLHGFLNSTDRSNNTYSKQQDTKNRQTAQAATKLAKLFMNK